MPEWLESPVQTDSLLPLPLLAFRLGMGLVCGVLVAGSYRLTQPRISARSLSLMATLVLLSILIAMVTLTIGNSVARAFSLVGALSIVRFRTVVEDTRDTAFVIFAVSIGMAAGAGYLQIPLVGIPVVTLAAWLFRARGSTGPGLPAVHQLQVRLGTGRDARSLLEPVFQNHLESWTLTSVATARQGTAYNLSYRTHLLTPGSAMPLVAELNQIDGVQEIELRDAGDNR